MPQYVNLEWFVTKEDHERAKAYAERHGLTKPCELMGHLLDLALGNEATGETLTVSTAAESPQPHDER